MDEKKAADGKAIIYNNGLATKDTVAKASKDFFQNEFADEKTDTSRRIVDEEVIPKTTTLERSRLLIIV